LPTGSPAGRRSLCLVLEDVIREKLYAGLTKQRIYQDITAAHQFKGSYQSLRRYVDKIQKAEDPATNANPIHRIEVQPGEEAQMDFGVGPWIIDSQTGSKRRTWVFRITLSFSRKAYSELLYRQDLESVIRAMENAFRHFGGVPVILRLDNFKAAVLKADWFDPEINPKFSEFCRHYNVEVIPCRPYSPQHKGKIERHIGYVKSNGIKGNEFSSLGEWNVHLKTWEKNVADQRIHGTCKRQVASMFEIEKTALSPLPQSLFESYVEGRRKVSRDSFIEWRQSYYEVQPEYIGIEVWARSDGRQVRIYSQKMELLQTHLLLEKGKFSRTLGSLGMSGPVRGSARRLIADIALYGDACRKWAEMVFERRGCEGIRTLFGMSRLAQKHKPEDLHAACSLALEEGLRSVRDIERLLKSPNRSKQMTFLTEHAVVRPLQTYDIFAAEIQNNRIKHDTRNHQATGT
jgi:transposase